jgi:hypothetical protein
MGFAHRAQLRQRKSWQSFRTALVSFTGDRKLKQRLRRLRANVPTLASTKETP